MWQPGGTPYHQYHQCENIVALSVATLAHLLKNCCAFNVHCFTNP